MAENENKKNISRHILPTSSNLLGLCFVILTFIKLSKIANETIIDESIGRAGRENLDRDISDKAALK
jgi:hypothetical protein